MTTENILERPYLGPTIVVLLLIGVFVRLQSPKWPSRVRMVGYEIRNKLQRKNQYTYAAPSLLQGGYSASSNDIFGVDSLQGMKLVLPIDMLDEVLKNPHLTFAESLSQDLLIDYTYMGGVDKEPLDGFKKGLNPNLAKFVPEFVELINRVIEEDIGQCDDWTGRQMWPIDLRLLGVLTARVLMGRSAADNPTWVSLTTDYVQDAVQYAHSLKEWPAFLYPIVCRWMPTYSKVQGQLNLARDIITQRFKEIDAEWRSPEDPPPVITVLAKNPKDRVGARREMQIKWQLNLGVGGIHTTASTLTQCIFELAVRPDLVKTLRNEVRRVFDEQKGEFDKASLSRMPRLDSFMREVHRLNSPNLTTLQRIATKPVTLSDGTFIPKGGRLEIPTFAVHRDMRYYENAETVEPERFLKLAQKADHDAHQVDPKNSYVSVTREHMFLGWGLGRTACPGRFLADVEIKLILSHLLLKYEMRNPSGAPRHPSVHFENQVFANPVGKVEFRRI